MQLLVISVVSIPKCMVGSLEEGSLARNRFSIEASHNFKFWVRRLIVGDLSITLTISILDT